MNPLPPQAYTKDTLVKAYSWLNTQGPSIKEMATTPDILVSLYLKATRDGDSSLDRPSIQNFKNELKSLAGLMGQLDNPQSANSTRSTVSHAAASPTTTTAMPAASSSPAPFAANSAPIMHAAPNHSQGPSAAFSTSTFGGYTHTQPSQAPAGATAQPQAHHAAPAAPASPVVNPSTLLTGLDALSLSLIQEVKNDLNLSSELEALRMLIKIGHSRSKKLL